MGLFPILKTGTGDIFPEDCGDVCIGPPFQRTAQCCARQKWNCPCLFRSASLSRTRVTVTDWRMPDAGMRGGQDLRGRDNGAMGRNDNWSAEWGPSWVAECLSLSPWHSTGTHLSLSFQNTWSSRVSQAHLSSIYLNTASSYSVPYIDMPGNGKEGDDTNLSR